MATSKLQVYECAVCGNMVEVIRAADGTLVCCDVPMNALTENTTDAAQEKHVPVIEKVDGGVKVTVGSVAHPMQADHSIEWIEAVAGKLALRHALVPGEAPEAVFPIEADGVAARAHCNLHGLWKSE